MAVYPFGIPLLFVGILAWNVNSLYLDDTHEERRGAVEKELQSIAFVEEKSQNAEQEHDDTAGKVTGDANQYCEEGAEYDRKAFLPAP